MYKNSIFLGFGPLHVLTYQDKTLFRPSIAYWMLLGSFSTARLKKIESYEIKHMMEFFFWFRAQPLPDTSWQLYSGVLLTTTCLKDHLVPEGWKKSEVKEITYDGQNWLFFLFRALPRPNRSCLNTEWAFYWLLDASTIIWNRNFVRNVKCENWGKNGLF